MVFQCFQVNSVGFQRGDASLKLLVRDLHVTGRPAMSIDEEAICLPAPGLRGVTKHPRVVGIADGIDSG